MEKLRSLVCTVVGHVDHGKTTILDRIRGTAVAASEAGLITQCISCTNIPFSVIENICKNLSQIKKIKIPGLLFLDTPGHASFTNLRKRGGNIADIAILVIDINEGIKPQTRESIEILRSYKTPFIIAANKIDLINGWHSDKKVGILESIKKQSERIREELDKKLYELVGELNKDYNLNAERFDRIDDYTKQIAIIPVSGKTSEGLPELLMVLTGLAQKFLEKELKIDTNKPGRGIVLEVKESKGLGTTLDVIIYDGCLKKNDQIIIGGLDEAVVTKIKALFEPDIKSKKLKNVDKVIAATGVKINAPNIEEVISGMPLAVANENLEKTKKEIQKEVEGILIETDKEGVIVKTDSLGSLEALINLLKERNISIRRASIGDINKNDIAEAVSEENKFNRVILGFNIKIKEENKDVKIITSNVIYKIVEEYEAWLKNEEKKLEDENLKNLTKPGKIQLLAGTVFRQNNPAICGVEVLIGRIKIGDELMNKSGEVITEIKSMQSEGEGVNEAKRSDKIAVAMPHVTIGRQVNEGEILYVNINEDDFRKLKDMKRFLNNDEINLLKEVAIIKRKENSMWGL